MMRRSDDPNTHNIPLMKLDCSVFCVFVFCSSLGQNKSNCMVMVIELWFLSVCMFLPWICCSAGWRVLSILFFDLALLDFQTKSSMLTHPFRLPQCMPFYTTHAIGACFFSFHFIYLSASTKFVWWPGERWATSFFLTSCFFFSVCVFSLSRRSGELISNLWIVARSIDS